MLFCYNLQYEENFIDQQINKTNLEYEQGIRRDYIQWQTNKQQKKKFKQQIIQNLINSYKYSEYTNPPQKIILSHNSQTKSKEMKSTNVRQLMNLLSQKYFGNDVVPSSSKPERITVKSYTKNDQSSLSILSPITSYKASPKFDRTSSSQPKKNQNFNYFEESRKYLDETRSKLQKPGNTFPKNNQRKRLEIKDTNEQNNVEQVESNNDEGFKYTYTRKYSQKDLATDNSKSNAYLIPITLGKINSTQIKSNNSRLVKEGITQSKGLSKKLFLKQNLSELNKIESNSTVSNSRSSYNLKRERENRQLAEGKQKEQQTKQKKQSVKLKAQQMNHNEELQFYKQRCFLLEQQNTQLKDKVVTYEEQFAEEKILVQNLTNMISKRELQINEIIEKRLGTFQKKQQFFETVHTENQTLKNELEEVRTILRQQESIIMELYAKNKQNSQSSKEKIPISKSPTGNNGTNTLTSLTSNCSSNNTNQSRQYGATYLQNKARQSIEESSFEYD